MALSRITEAVASFTDLTIGDDLTLTDDFLMASDANIIKFGADADVTLTHVHNTGLLLNSTSVIQFNDASQNIGATSATTLDINATDEIELNATLLDVNANINASGTYTGAGLMTTGGNIVIPDAGFIGSASDTDAIQIEADGDIVFSQDVAITGTLTVNGTTTTVNSTTVTVGEVVLWQPTSRKLTIKDNTRTLQVGDTLTGATSTTARTIGAITDVMTFGTDHSAQNIEFESHTIQVKSGEMIVVPKGVMHKPFAKKECKVMLVEPRGVLNTGDTKGDMTAPNNQWI